MDSTGSQFVKTKSERGRKSEMRQRYFLQVPDLLPCTYAHGAGLTRHNELPFPLLSPSGSPSLLHSSFLFFSPMANLRFLQILSVILNHYPSRSKSLSKLCQPNLNLLSRFSAAGNFCIWTKTFMTFGVWIAPKPHFKKFKRRLNTSEEAHHISKGKVVVLSNS